MTVEGCIVLEVSSLTEGLTRIVLSGRLDTPGVDQVETQFVAAAVPPAKNVVVDLSRVTFISSMGIRMLVSVARSLQQRPARRSQKSPPEPTSGSDGQRCRSVVCSVFLPRETDSPMPFLELR